MNQEVSEYLKIKDLNFGHLVAEDESRPNIVETEVKVQILNADVNSSKQRDQTPPTGTSKYLNLQEMNISRLVPRLRENKDPNLNKADSQKLNYNQDNLEF
jgi:hypothetical protein